METQTPPNPEDPTRGINSSELARHRIATRIDSNFQIKLHSTTLNHQACFCVATYLTSVGAGPRAMKIRDARITKIASLVQSLDEELKELESAHRIQFDVKGSLQEKLSASKHARASLKKARRLQGLIAEILIEPDD